MSRSEKFEGAVLDPRSGTISYKGQGGQVGGAQARVETAGEVSQRFTATRLALLGPFALAFRNKKDNRELYLTVEGPGYGFVIEINPKKGIEARQFAAAVNAAASAPAVRVTPSYAPAMLAYNPPNAIPAAWYPDPQGVATHRWWDGGQWTNHTQP